MPPKTSPESAPAHAPDPTDRAPGRWTSTGVGRQLALAAKSSRAFFEQLLAEQGASFGVWSILAVLTESGPLIQRDLAKRLSIEGPTLTRHLSLMEARGLVKRDRATGDRRTALVTITPSGRKLSRRLAGVADECYGVVMQGFTAEEIDLLRSMLQRVHHNAVAVARARSGG